MSGGDKSGKPKAKLILAAIAGLLLLALALGSVAYLQSEYRKDAENNAAEYSKQASYQIEHVCDRIEWPPSEVECLEQAINAKRESQRGEYDLYAQRTMALWTVLVGVAAAFGLGLSVVGVYLIFITFRETREAANQARRGANEAQRAADAFVDAERPHLEISSLMGGIDRENPARWLVAMRIHNVGASPAILEEIEWAGMDEQRFPGMGFPDRGSASKDLNETIPSDGKSLLPSIHVPLSARYIGGYIRFRSRFRPDHIKFFLIEMVVGGEDRRSSLRIQKRYASDGWPEDT